MGSVSSQLSGLQVIQKFRRVSVDSGDSVMYDISEDVLIHILSFLPPSDLLKSCSRVCRQWKQLIDGHTIWKRKCQRDGKTIPKYNFKTIPEHFYRNIYVNNPYGRNLLRNPCGAESMASWTITASDGDGWTVESEPQGADPVPPEAGGVSCFATSYMLCEKHQTIDLIKEGINEELLDEVHPPIAVGEWHAARFDCGSTYVLVVTLLDEKQAKIDAFEYGPYTEGQWTGRAWTKVEHVFRDYKPGVRYIGFQHCGKDTQFWAGHYGSKMTGGYVRFLWED